MSLERKVRTCVPTLARAALMMGIIRKEITGTRRLVNGILAKTPRFHFILFFTRSPLPLSPGVALYEPEDQLKSEGKSTMIFYSGMWGRGEGMWSGPQGWQESNRALNPSNMGSQSFLCTWAMWGASKVQGPGPHALEI